MQVQIASKQHVHYASLFTFFSFSSISTVVIWLLSAQLDYTDPFMAKNNYLNFDDGIIILINFKMYGVQPGFFFEFLNPWTFHLFIIFPPLLLLKHLTDDEKHFWTKKWDWNCATMEEKVEIDW